MDGFVILRVDDRLIHGQVTAGWARPLGIQRIIIANDRVAADEWEREIYQLAVPREIEARILTVEETLQTLHETSDRRRTMVLVDTLTDAQRLIAGSLKLAKVNVGGLHFEPGRHRLAPYIYVTDDDLAAIGELHRAGIALEGREIPGAPAVDVAVLAERVHTGGGRCS